MMRSRIVPAIIGITLLLSAVSKLIDPAPTLLVFHDIWNLSGFIEISGFVALISIETLLGLLFLTSANRVISGAGALLCAIFLMSVLRQLILHSQIGCGCGGSFGRLGPRAQQYLALVKSTALLACCVALILPSRRLSHSAAEGDPQCR